MQEPWTIQKVLQWTIARFTEKNIPDPRLSAEMLLAHALHCKRIDLYLQFERILTADELTRYRNFIKRRLKNEPVQYIIGEQDFMGLTFKVTPDVLIPRPETELLVEKVLEEAGSRGAENPAVLDVGTGSGAIAISIAHHCGRCRVTAIDDSETALRVARENADLLKVRVEFILQDALLINPEEWKKFALIAVNPPYIAEEDRPGLHPQVRDFEPARALFAGPGGLDFYRSFIPLLPQLLEENGVAFMEIGYDQRNKINELLKKENFKQVQFIRDYRQIERIVKVQK